MSEYAVFLSETVVEFLDAADEKTKRICKEKLGFLADDPYPGGGRGDKEKLPIDGQRDRYRLHISRPVWILTTDHSRHGLDSMTNQG